MTAEDLYFWIEYSVLPYYRVPDPNLHFILFTELCWWCIWYKSKDLDFRCMCYIVDLKISISSTWISSLLANIYPALQQISFSCFKLTKVTLPIKSIFDKFGACKFHIIGCFIPLKYISAPTRWLFSLFHWNSEQEKEHHANTL